jgi:uncharacterized phiE125 gp8 family phage protein
MHLQRTAPPAVEPVELVAAKNHLRLEIEDDDELVYGLIVAARELVEGWTSRSLITTGWRLTLDGFSGYWPWPTSLERSIDPGGRIKFPIADVLAVSAVNYLNTSGSTVLLGSSNYTVVPGAPGYLLPAYGTSWPSTRRYHGALTIDFTAGYGPAPADVPGFVKQAILLLLGHLYENREATVTSSIGLREAPLGVQMMVALADWGATG